MTRKLDLSARQVTAICKGAAKAGFVAEIIVGGIVMRLVPEAAASVLFNGKQSPANHERLAKHLGRGEHDDDWDDASLSEFRWGGPLHLAHRKEKVLRVLVDAKGAAREADGIPYAGPHTVNKLIERGLVELVDKSRPFVRAAPIKATAAGLSFFSRREEDYRRRPFCL